MALLSKNRNTVIKSYGPAFFECQFIGGKVKVTGGPVFVAGKIYLIPETIVEVNIEDSIGVAIDTITPIETQIYAYFYNQGLESDGVVYMRDEAGNFVKPGDTNIPPDAATTKPIQEQYQSGVSEVSNPYIGVNKQEADFYKEIAKIGETSLGSSSLIQTYTGSISLQPYSSASEDFCFSAGAFLPKDIKLI